MTIWFWRSFNPPVRRLPQVSHFFLTLASGRFFFFLPLPRSWTTQSAVYSDCYLFAIICVWERCPRDSELCISFREYSRTSCKLPPKMQRLSGRLREVVVYEKRTSWGLFRDDVRPGHIYSMEDNLLHAISKIMICAVPFCYLSSSYILGRIVHTANIKIKQYIKKSLTRA